MMESFAYFPALIYRDERPDFVEPTLLACLEYFNECRQEGKSIHQSRPLIGDLALQNIANYLLISSVNILREQGYDVSKYDFYLSGLWAQEIAGNLGTDVHIHKNSQICGWLFLETPDDGAYPVYYDSRANKAMNELDFVQGQEVNNATNSIHFNNILPGTVLFNNSWMRHQLVSGAANRPTRCIHFIVSHRDRLCSI